MKLTEKILAKIEYDDKNKRYWDENKYKDVSLCLLVSKKVKKWQARYINPETKKDTWFAIGYYPETSLRQAQDLASQISIRNVNIESSSHEENEKKMTFAEFSNIYIEKWAKVRKKTWKEDVRIIDRELIAWIGDLPLEKISKNDVVALIDKIVERGSLIMANRTHGLIHKILSFAAERGMIDNNPMVGLKAPSKERRRDRYLDQDEIYKLLSSLLLDHKSIDQSMKNLILFHLATASRSSEVCFMTFDEIKNDAWVIPKERSKNGIERRLPMTSFMNEIISTQKISMGQGDSFVFTNKKTGNSFHSTSEYHSLVRIQKKAAILPFTAHDLRRTAASQLSILRVNRTVIKKILNHVDRDITDIYDRNNYDSEKFEALSMWNDVLKKMISEILDGQKNKKEPTGNPVAL